MSVMAIITTYIVIQIMVVYMLLEKLTAGVLEDTNAIDILLILFIAPGVFIGFIVWVLMQEDEEDE